VGMQWETRNSFKILFGKSHGKKPFWTKGGGERIRTDMDNKERVMNRTELVHDRVKDDKNLTSVTGHFWTS